MLFKWNSQIDCKPDLDELSEFSKENKDKSVFLKSFSEAIKAWYNIDIKEVESTQIIKKGTKAELIQYLMQEVGWEIDIQWRTEFFYMSAQVKADELGQIIGILNRSGLVWLYIFSYYIVEEKI